MDGVEVALLVAVFTGVLVGLLVDVLVGEFVAVGVGLFVAVRVGVLVGLFVMVYVAVLVKVLVAVLVGVLVGVFVGLLVGLTVGVFVRVNVAVKATAEGVAVGGIVVPDRQTLSIQKPTVEGAPWVSHWRERICVMAWACVIKFVVEVLGTGGGQRLYPQSPHSKAFLVRVTCIQVLGWATTKLNPYWLSFPPPLPASVTPW